MKIITKDEVIKIATDSIKTALNDEQIGHINDILTDATYRFNTDNGMSYIAIHKEDIDGISDDFPLQLLATLLSANGWKARYMYDQRDGDWVHVDLPRINL